MVLPILASVVALVLPFLLGRFDWLPPSSAFFPHASPCPFIRSAPCSLRCGAYERHSADLKRRDHTLGRLPLLSLRIHLVRSSSILSLPAPLAGKVDSRGLPSVCVLRWEQYANQALRACHLPKMPARLR